MILRGLLLASIATAAFFVASAQHEAPQIVAHRGCSLSGYTYANWRRDPYKIEMARKLGMELMAWTANNPDHIKWLVEQGFDYILTDDPAMMRNVLKEMCK